MIDNDKAGVCCDFEAEVTSKSSSDWLVGQLKWNKWGNPECPLCGDEMLYEEYIDE